jgi:hypothetical protein
MQTQLIRKSCVEWLASVLSAQSSFGLGGAVVYALAEQLDREWSVEDAPRAQPPEGLSLAADDYVETLRNARRRLGLALRSAAQQVAEALD